MTLEERRKAQAEERIRGFAKLPHGMLVRALYPNERLGEGTVTDHVAALQLKPLRVWFPLLGKSLAFHFDQVEPVVIQQETRQPIEPVDAGWAKLRELYQVPEGKMLLIKKDAEAWKGEDGNYWYRLTAAEAKQYAHVRRDYYRMDENNDIVEMKEAKEVYTA